MWVLNFVPWILAALVAGALSRLFRTRWPLLIFAPMLVVLYDVFAFSLPFVGVATEVAVELAATVALIPAFLIFLLYSHWLDEKPWAWPAVALLLLALFGMVLVPWTARLTYAQQVAWVCDGVIESKYRSNNHNAAALSVRTAGGTVTLEGVEESTWARAAVGDHLLKQGGSIYAELNRQTVRAVPRVMPWRNEPDANRLAN